MQLSDTLRATIRWLRERGEASRERESVGNGRRARLGKAVAELPSQRSPARAGSTLFDSPTWKTDCSPRMLGLAVIGSLLPAFRFSLPLHSPAQLILRVQRCEETTSCFASSIMQYYNRRAADSGADRGERLVRS